MTNEQYNKLLHSFPRMHREIVEGKTSLAFSFGLIVFFVGLLGRVEPLWPTMVGAILGPLLSTLVLILKPLNPYEGNMYAKQQGISFSQVRHVTGTGALVELLKSRAALVHAVNLAAFSALALVILLLIVSLTLGRIFPMHGHSRIIDQVVIDSFMFGLAVYGVETMLLLRWAVQRMRQQEFPEI